MEELIAAAQGIASVRYRRHAPKVWFMMVAKNMWQGIVINSVSKEILDRGPVVEFSIDDEQTGPEQALQALIDDIKSTFVSGTKKGI